MNVERWKIRPKYHDMVMRYQSETNIAKRIEMKYRFVQWLSENYYSLTEAEIEYLQTCICIVEDVN